MLSRKVSESNTSWSSFSLGSEAGKSSTSRPAWGDDQTRLVSIFSNEAIMNSDREKGASAQLSEKAWSWPQGWLEIFSSERLSTSLRNYNALRAPKNLPSGNFHFKFQIFDEKIPLISVLPALCLFETGLKMCLADVSTKFYTWCTDWWRTRRAAFVLSIISSWTIEGLWAFSFFTQSMESQFYPCASQNTGKVQVLSRVYWVWRLLECGEILQGLWQSKTIYTKKLKWQPRVSLSKFNRWL